MVQRPLRPLALLQIALLALPPLLVAPLIDGGTALASSTMWQQRGRRGQIAIDGEPYVPMQAGGLTTRLRERGSRVAAEIVLPALPAGPRPRSRRADVAAPLQVGVHRELPRPRSGDLNVGTLAWQPHRDGGVVGALRVTSPGAAAVRLAVAVRQIRRGVELRFFGEGSDRVFGPYDRRLLRAGLGSAEPTAATAPGADAQDARGRVFWSPVLDGPGGGVEIYAPDFAAAERLDLSIVSVSHLTSTPSAASRDLSDIGAADGCEIDVACEPGALRLADSVAKIIFSTSDGTFLCSGQLVNDTDGDTFNEYFSTANHCVASQADANSIDFYWFFQRSSCGGGDPTSVVQTTGGAWMLHSADADAATDLSLMKLKQPAAGGTFLSGWDSGQAGGAVIGIHHPAGDLKKISSGTISGVEPWFDQPFDSHYRVHWDSGVTEGGSSGSGLWSGERLVGVLTGGSSYCSSPGDPDLYGRLDLTFPDLRPWLDPGSLPAFDDRVSGSVSGGWSYFRTSGSGADLEVSLEARGSAELFVHSAHAPTAELYDCRAADRCTIAAAAGSYYIGVQGDAEFTLRVGGDDNGGDDPPAAPTGQAPDGVIDTTAPTYTWSGVEGAERYELRIVRGGATLYEALHAADDLCAGSDCRLTSPPAPELAAGDLHWNVRAHNDNGAGDWSGTLSFTVDSGNDDDDDNGGDPPAAPVAIGPDGDIDTDSPSYRWSHVANAESYELRIESNGTTLYDASHAAAAICSASECSLPSPPAPTLEDGDHRWEVRARNTHGAGGWSRTLSFTVDTGGDDDSGAVPTAPSTNLPAGPTDTAAPTYGWKAVAGATAYQVRISDSDRVLYEDWASTEVACSGDRCNLETPPAPQLSDGDHEWQVRGRNDEGEGDWSAPSVFRVATEADLRPPARAFLLWPFGRTGPNPTFEWFGDADATSYVLRIDGPSGRVHEASYAAAEICDFDYCVLDGSRAPTLGGGKHRWSVLSRNAGGDAPWSHAATFKVRIRLDQPATLTPAGRISTIRPTYRWTEVPGATRYEIQVSGPYGRVTRRWIDASRLCSGGVCEIGTPPLPTLYPGRFAWWVRAGADGATGPRSSRQRFRVR